MICVGRVGPSRRANCGGCGYTGCRAFAEALVEIDLL
ncbi:MAG: (Fe-S)-binding protein [Bacteroidales bacterium]|nr:(Fe-S)-binding protein [Bacteroidales bacterium]